jgi:hypothetical protein
MERVGATSTEGQASVEWIAVVALVAVLLGATGTALAQAGFLGRSVTRQLARAICVVSAGDCWRDREPCVIASDSKAGNAAVQLAVVKLGGGRIAVVEQRSDGTFAVTRGSSALLTIQASTGPQHGFSLAGLNLSAAAALTAAYGGTAEAGRTWILPSRAAVDELLDGLRDRPVAGGGGRGATPQVIHGSAPPPDITYNKLATEASINAFAGAHVGDDTVTLASADLRFDRDAGTRVDHRTGHRTIYSRASSHVMADGAGVFGFSSTTGGETYAVEFDANGRPLDLEVTAIGPYGGTADLPDALQQIAGLLGPGAPDGGRAYVVETHLDLTDPANLSAARGLLDALRPHFGSPAAAARALRERIDAHGTVEARVVDRSEDAGSHDLSLPVGPPVSVAWGHANVTSRLRAAVSRGLDGQWIPRTGCLA